jgi:hypothetical protein
MDRADLPALYMRARESKGVVKAQDAIATMLLGELRKVFHVEEQARLI